MANDNQTALMQSIARRKTRLVKLEKLFKEHGYQNLYLDGQIQVMKDEIAEDEKLLLVEMKQHEESFIQGNAYLSPNKFGYYWNQKYGTDGK